MRPHDGQGFAVRHQFAYHIYRLLGVAGRVFDVQLQRNTIDPAGGIDHIHRGLRPDGFPLAHVRAMARDAEGRPDADLLAGNGLSGS